MEQGRAEALLRQLDAGWRLNADGHLERVFKFRSFKDALAFANKVGEIAEAQRHHPDLRVAWGACAVEVWTHKIDGLTDSDFYFAAKVDQAFASETAPA